MRLSSKVALITGAAAGMGRASALLFSTEGAKVAVVDIDREGGHQTVDSVKQRGGHAIFIEADVSQAPDVQRMVMNTVDAFGKLDILFNNAGVPMSSTPMEDVSEDIWDRIIAINVKSVFLGCKYAIPIMKKQGRGVIINTASIIGVRPRPGLSAYLASKAAVITLTKGLALELASSGIRVNCINPVATDTAMLPKFINKAGVAASNYEEGRRSFIATIPLGRLATGEDVAYAALYLASDEAAMVTGASLNVDGGRGV